MTRSAHCPAEAVIPSAATSAARATGTAKHEMPVAISGQRSAAYFVANRARVFAACLFFMLSDLGDSVDSDRESTATAHPLSADRIPEEDCGSGERRSAGCRSAGRILYRPHAAGVMPSQCVAGLSSMRRRSPRRAAPAPRPGLARSAWPVPLPAADSDGRPRQRLQHARPPDPAGRRRRPSWR
jgi:hypothetical protein